MSSRSPSNSPRNRRLRDDLDMAVFHSGKTLNMDYYQGSSGLTSVGPSVQKLVMRGSAYANDKLTDTIERAKKSIQDARKSRQKDVNER